MESTSKASWRAGLIVAVLVSVLLGYFAVVARVFPANYQAIITISMTVAWAVMVLVVGWWATRREIQIGIPSKLDYYLLLGANACDLVFWGYMCWFVAAMTTGAFGPQDQAATWPAVALIGLCILMVGLWLGYRRRRARRTWSARRVPARTK